MSEAQIIPPEVREGPPTMALVYLMLDRVACGLTYEELAEGTGRSKRTVKSAVGDLREAGLVISRPDHSNPRQKIHFLDR